jgi:hypothetical protein
MSSALARRAGPIHLTPTAVPIPTSTLAPILLPRETPEPITGCAAYANGNEVVTLAREGIRLWAATHGGAVCGGV